MSTMASVILTTVSPWQTNAFSLFAMALKLTAENVESMECSNLCVCGQRPNKKRLFTFFFSAAQLWEFAKPENAYDGSTKLVENTEFEQRFNSAIFDFVGRSFLCQFENNSLGISLVSFKAFLS